MKTAHDFIKALTEYDARDGADQSFDDASLRAAKYATGSLAESLGKPRTPSPDADWAELRKDQAFFTTEVTSIDVPVDLAPPTPSIVHVRVAYRRILTSKSAEPRHSSFEVSLRLNLTDAGWRVAGLRTR
ncbi:hypothetical protein [Streptomyces sp. URMC 123]|uniref:hypothetical protein n=1 Tax=Streptomyces sp. URMC 123 TaxID=3423403 RepID=UPI003F19D63A